MPMRLVERCAHRAARLSRAAKVSIAVAVDVSGLPAMLLAALTLRYESIAAAAQVAPVLFIAAAAFPVATFALMGMYRAIFRFVSGGTLFTTGLGVVGSTALLGLVNSMLSQNRAPISSIVFFGALALLYVVGTRVLVREWLFFRRGQKERVLVYGAGEAGAQLIRSLRESGQYVPMGFIDSGSSLQGRMIGGLKVYSPQKLPRLIEKHNITSVLLAIPSSSRRQRQDDSEVARTLSRARSNSSRYQRHRMRQRDRCRCSRG